MTAQAVHVGVNTAEIQAVGDHPYPYALMRHARGSNASADKNALADEKWAETIERGTLMLVLDGLAMSYAWAGSDDPAHLGGIRGWLQSIKNICDTAMR